MLSRFDGIFLAITRAASLHMPEFNVLEIGCGDGRNAAMIREMADRLDGVEPDILLWNSHGLRNIYDELHLTSFSDVSLTELDGHWFIVMRDLLPKIPMAEAFRLLRIIQRARLMAYLEVPYPAEGGREFVRAQYPMLTEVHSEPGLGAWVLWP